MRRWVSLALLGAALAAHAEDHEDARRRGDGGAAAKPAISEALAEDLRLFLPRANTQQRERVFRELAALGRGLHTGRNPDEVRNANIDRVAERCVELLPGHPNLRQVLTVARSRAIQFESKKQPGGGYQDEYYFYEIIRAGARTILRADGVGNLGGEPRSPAEASPGQAERRLIEQISERHGR